MPATRETKQGRPTYKEKKFCEYLVQYREEKRYLPERQAAFASYHIRENDDSTADNIALENLTKQRCIEEIARIEGNLERNFTQEKYQAILLDLAQKADNHTAKAKYLELYGKSRAFLTEKRENTNRNSFVLDEDFNKLPIQEQNIVLEKRLKLSSQGVNTSENVAKVGK